MKPITKEKLKELFDENSKTIKALEDDKLKFIATQDKIRYLDFTDRFGTQKFKYRVYSVYDEVAKDFIRNNNLYKFYKGAVNEAIKKNPKESELKIRRYYLNMLDTTKIEKNLQMALSSEVESRFYTDINLQGLIEESATDGSEIHGVGLLFKLNRKYYIQPKYDKDIIIVLGKEKQYVEKFKDFPLEKKVTITDNEVLLEVIKKGYLDYTTVVRIKKEKHYTEEEISEAFDKLADKLKIYRYLILQKRYYIMEYQKGYQEYEKHYNKIKETVKNIGTMYEGYGNLYSPNSESMKTIYDELDAMVNILRGNDGVRLINETMERLIENENNNKWEISRNIRKIPSNI